jgi:hypothetical protein
MQHLQALKEEQAVTEFAFWPWFFDHWIMYAGIFLLMAFVFNQIFRAGPLPLLKNLVLYALMAAGAFILLIFQIDANLPIIECLAIAAALILIVRIRHWFAAKKEGGSKRDS